jgi:hypothetical protein
VSNARRQRSRCLIRRARTGITVLALAALYLHSLTADITQLTALIDAIRLLFEALATHR